MRSFLNTLRSILVVLSLIAAIVAWVFIQAPEQLAAVDARAVEAAGEAPLETARALATQVETDPKRAEAGLRSFLDEHRDVIRGDRAFGAHRTARRAMVAALRASGDVPAAMEEALRYANEDPRDLTTRLWAGRLALEVDADPATRARALALLLDAFHELPELGATTRALFDAYSTLGADREALDVLCEHLAVSHRPMLSAEGVAEGWEVWWSGGGPEGAALNGGTLPTFDADHHALPRVVVTPTYAALTFELPAGVRQLRIDPPGGARLAFERTIFALVAESGPASLDLSELELDVREMTFDGTTLVVEGASDPGFIFTLPVEHGAEAVTARLVLVTPRIPRWMERVLAALADEAFEAALTQLREHPGERVVDPAGGAERIRDLRQRAIEARGETSR